VFQNPKKRADVMNVDVQKPQRDRRRVRTTSLHVVMEVVLMIDKDAMERRTVPTDLMNWNAVRTHSFPFSDLGSKFSVVFCANYGNNSFMHCGVKRVGS